MPSKHRVRWKASKEIIKPGVQLAPQHRCMTFMQSKCCLRQGQGVHKPRAM